MKSAIYIRDGRTQVVLTPESDLEKSALKQIEDAGGEVFTTRGSFYDCEGGWTREGGSDESLIFVIDAAPK